MTLKHLDFVVMDFKDALINIFILVMGQIIVRNDLVKGVVS